MISVHLGVFYKSWPTPNRAPVLRIFLSFALCPTLLSITCYPCPVIHEVMAINVGSSCKNILPRFLPHARMRHAQPGCRVAFRRHGKCQPFDSSEASIDPGSGASYSTPKMTCSECLFSAINMQIDPACRCSISTCLYRADVELFFSGHWVCCCQSRPLVL